MKSEFSVMTKEFDECVEELRPRPLAQAGSFAFVAAAPSCWRSVKAAGSTMCTPWSRPGSSLMGTASPSGSRSPAQAGRLTSTTWSPANCPGQLVTGDADAGLKSNIAATIAGARWHKSHRLRQRRATATSVSLTCSSYADLGSMARRVSIVSASSGALSSRYLTTRANRSATPPG